MENFGIDRVERLCIDVVLVFQNIHQAIHHFRLNTQFKPFVVEVEPNTCFNINNILIELYDLLVAVFLLSFFRIGGKVEGILHASHQIRPEIIVPDGLVFDFKREIYISGWDLFNDLEFLDRFFNSWMELVSLKIVRQCSITKRE